MPPVFAQDDRVPSHRTAFASLAHWKLPAAIIAAPLGIPHDLRTLTRPSMRETWTFHSAGQFLFGRNATSQLGEVVGRWGAKRLLIATDPVLEKAGLVEHV